MGKKRLKRKIRRKALKAMTVAMTELMDGRLFQYRPMPKVKKRMVKIRRRKK